MGSLQIKKGIRTLHDWDKQHIFYNPLFKTENGKTLKLTEYCKVNNIYNYEQLVEEKRKQLDNIPFHKNLTCILDKILVDTSVRKEDILVNKKGEEIKLNLVTQKMLYEDALLSIQRDHHSQTKWLSKLINHIEWNKVWNSVHNILATNEIKNVIWQQIHLNFYTQYSYNKWHKKEEICPLCKKIPENIFHIILHCEVTNELWNGIEPILTQIYPTIVTEEEKAFGIAISKQNTGILLRNWLTYLLRYCISKAERAAYHTPTLPTLEYCKRKFNCTMKTEIHLRSLQYKHDRKLGTFEKIITFRQIICKTGWGI